MYRIIGADGREYGPISADQLRQWITEGRANAQTRVQAEGSAEWKPLSSIPEFAEALAAKAGPPPVTATPAIAVARVRLAGPSERDGVRFGGWQGEAGADRRLRREAGRR